MASLPSNKRSRTYNTTKNHWVEDLLQPESKFDNLMPDPSTWVVGSTGSQVGYESVGLDSENAIVEGYGPAGVKIPIWECTPSGDGGSDGGYYTVLNPATLDHTKAYRVTSFHKRTGDTTGIEYLGVSGTGSALLKLAGATASPAYIFYGDTIESEGWVLIEGYVFPSAYTGTVTIGGRYQLSTGEKLAAQNGYDCKFAATTTGLYLRNYLAGSSASNKLSLTRPRIDLIDGTEPPLALMLAHTATFTADYTDAFVKDSSGNTGSIFVQTTRPTMSIGDYWIDYSSGINRVFWRDAGRIVELQPHFNNNDPLAPSAVKIDSVDPIYLSEAQSGKRQLRSSAPQRYEATVSFPVQTRSEFRQVDSFLSLMRNTASSFYLALPIISESEGWLNGNPFIKGSGQSGNSIVTDGWWYIDGELMVANGDWLKIEGSDKLYRATADCYAQSTLEITIPITPKLQFTPADNAAVLFVNPEMKVDLVGVHKFSVKPPELYSYEIDVIEVIE